MLKLNSPSISHFPPSKHLFEKKENTRRFERIKVLTSFNEVGQLPLFLEENPKILNDKDLFRIALTKHPKLADRISAIIPPSILFDEDFMLEMYHLTKYLGIFQTINSESQLFKLLKIDIRFFEHCRIPASIIRDDRIMQKCLKNYPKLLSLDYFPLHIKREYKMLASNIKIINTVKTFLLCTMSENGRLRHQRGFSGLIVHEICQYLKPAIYKSSDFIGPIPVLPSMLQKCRHYHSCKHCDNLARMLGRRITKQEYYQAKYKPCIAYKLCEKCPNREERKRWVEIIRNKAKEVYGLRVV